MRIYTIAQQKGGAAKSTVAPEVVAELARGRETRRARRVLAIDCDSSRAFTQRLGHSSGVDPALSILDYCAGVATLDDLVVPSPSVPGADVVRANRQVKNLPADEVTQLRDLLPPQKRWHDCVIDTPGDLGTVTLAAMVAADVIVIPVETKPEGLDGIDDTMDFLAGKVANLRRGRPRQQVWYVPTRLGNNALGREVVDWLEERFPGQVTNPIRENVSVSEAYSAKMPASVYKPRSKGALDLAAAAATIIKGRK